MNNAQRLHLADARCKRIAAIVAGEFGCPVVDIYSRARASADARHVAMWLARELTGCTQPDIAKLFGGFDLSTVQSAIQSVGRRRQSDRQYAARTTAILDKARPEIERMNAAEFEIGSVKEACAIVDAGLAEIGKAFEIRAHTMARKNPAGFLALMSEFTERLGETS